MVAKSTSWPSRTLVVGGAHINVESVTETERCDIESARIKNTGPSSGSTALTTAPSNALDDECCCINTWRMMMDTLANAVELAADSVGEDEQEMNEKCGRVVPPNTSTVIVDAFPPPPPHVTVTFTRCEQFKMRTADEVVVWLITNNGEVQLIVSRASGEGTACITTTSDNSTHDITREAFGGSSKLFA